MSIEEDYIADKLANKLEPSPRVIALLRIQSMLGIFVGDMTVYEFESLEEYAARKENKQ